MAAKKKPAWLPPAGLKVEVYVGRGDVSFKAEAAIGDALNVARLLVAMVRQVGQDAPDTLPIAETVHGSVFAMDDVIWDAEGAKPPRRLGFK